MLLFPILSDCQIGSRTKDILSTPSSVEPYEEDFN